MGQPDRTQDAKTVPTDGLENASEGQNAIPKPLLEPEPSSTAKSDAVARVDQPIRQATGPRTPEGKQRSKENSLKHGLFSKVAVRKGEPQADFDSLLSGLREDFCPIELLKRS
jgi:hypothetical protein